MKEWLCYMCGKYFDDYTASTPVVERKFDLTTGDTANIKMEGVTLAPDGFELKFDNTYVPPELGRMSLCESCLYEQLKILIVELRLKS